MRVLLWCIGLMFCAVIPHLAQASQSIQSVRIWPSPDSTRVVFDLTGRAQYRLLAQQGNLVQLEITNITKPSLGRMSGESDLVKDIKVQRLAGNQGIRLQIDLSRQAQVNAFTLPPSANFGHRLVVDLADSRVSAVEPETPRPSTPRQGPGRDIIIAIDAGHGGHDPGAVGPGGSYEKNVNMAVSERLVRLINQEPGFRAVMTRTADYYIFPSKRPEIARRKQADLLVSVHADAGKNRQVHGGSVWILSLKRATTEVGRMLEQTERHSELLGGVGDAMKESNSERYLAQTFLDLSMNHSMTTSFEVAKKVLAEMGKVTHLHKREPAAASLGVLRAPDIPSILIETGFISNAAEERKLNTSSHQQALAAAIFRALRSHFQQMPPADSWLAQRRGQGVQAAANPVRQTAGPVVTTRAAPVQPGPIVRTTQPAHRAKVHVVRRGETLSGLARQYGVPMATLRRHNQLKSDNIQVGQRLRIPN